MTKIKFACLSTLLLLAIYLVFGEDHQFSFPWSLFFVHYPESCTSKCEFCDSYRRLNLSHTSVNCVIRTGDSSEQTLYKQQMDRLHYGRMMIT